MSEEEYEPSELHKRAVEIYDLLTNRVVPGCEHLHEWEATKTTVAVCGYCVDQLRCFECHHSHLLRFVHHTTYCDVHPDRLAVKSEPVTLNLTLKIEPPDGYQGRYRGQITVMPCIHWCEGCAGPSDPMTPAA